jgi:hypothetical protein
MNWLKCLVIISVSLTCACAASFNAEGRRFIYIGDIPAVCPITIKLVSHSMPEGFRIGPEEAVKLASEHSWVKCNSVFLQQVFIDAENYYIIKPVFGPMSEESDAVVVNGKSGKVTIRTHK